MKRRHDDKDFSTPVTVRKLDSAVNHSTNPGHQTYMKLFTTKVGQTNKSATSIAAAASFSAMSRSFYKTCHFDEKALLSIIHMDDKLFRTFILRYKPRPTSNVYFVDPASMSKAPDMSKHIMAFSRKVTKNDAGKKERTECVTIT